MDRTRTDHADAPAPLRLRIPAALAVVVLGGAAGVAMTFAACDVEPVPPEPTDASDRIGKDFDPDDADIDSNEDDADTEPRLRDAYVPPDTPVG